MSPLFLNVASLICFALASGMVLVLHVLEHPAFIILKDSRGNISESTETLLLLKETKNMLGTLLAARVQQIKAGLLVAGTIFSAILLFQSKEFVSLRGLLVLCGILFIPIMAKSALPAARRLAEVPPSAETTELATTLGELLRANCIGTLATVFFLLFSILVSCLG